ncbi:gas vesicle protein [Nonomuraea sp. K274]|uniref:Gas vesicle protein n=1 Tax=Nonomuraea cypriaca TaxID=1187855 RepID=A0A931A649_9ACTN|nr:gas vesicle protein [Nonomuraea cypriaca]MBF8185424.1 gas vesicle protein [Nonomuraea cypriaca]
MRRDVVAQERLPAERVALVDLLDRLLTGGVVLTGDLVLSIADVDLVRISLRALIASVDELSADGLSLDGLSLDGLSADGLSLDGLEGTT